MINIKEVKKWLNTINHDYNPMQYKLKNVNIENYYNENQLKSNNFIMINKLIKYKKDGLYNDKILNEHSKYVQVFNKYNKKYYFYINQYSNRYYVNMLFNQMIDYCIENKILDNDGNYLINKKLRSKFILFCYANTIYKYYNYLKI